MLSALQKFVGVKSGAEAARSLADTKARSLAPRPCPVLVSSYIRVASRGARCPAIAGCRNRPSLAVRCPFCGSSTGGLCALWHARCIAGGRQQLAAERVGVPSRLSCLSDGLLVCCVKGHRGGVTIEDSLYGVRAHTCVCPQTQMHAYLHPQGMSSKDSAAKKTRMSDNDRARRTCARTCLCVCARLYVCTCVCVCVCVCVCICPHQAPLPA